MTFFSIFIIFIIFSHITGFDPGERIYDDFIFFLLEMLKILPCAFIFIGLFEVWVKKKTLQKYLSGIKGYFFALLLAGITVGGIFVAFPVSLSLHRKGVKFSIIFTYIFASAICRIPMTIFEASFLGLKFSTIRLMTSIPLIIIASILLGGYLEKKKFRFKTL